MLLTLREGKHIVQNIISLLADDPGSLQNEDGGWPQWSEIARESDLWSTCYAVRFLHRYLHSEWLHDLRGDVKVIKLKLEKRLECSLLWLEENWSGCRWQYGSKSPWMTNAPLAYLEISECLKTRSSDLLHKPIVEFKQLLNAAGYVRSVETGLSAAQDLSDYRLGVWLCFCLSEVADTDEDARAIRDLLWDHLIERGHCRMDLRTYEWAFVLLLYSQIAERRHSAGNQAAMKSQTLGIGIPNKHNRCKEIALRYSDACSGLLAVKDLTTLIHWLIEWLSPVYQRIRVYWYDAAEACYYGLASHGMEQSFQKEFDIDLTGELMKSYPIPYSDVVYRRLTMYPRVKFLNIRELEKHYIDQSTAPSYHKDLFKSVDQTLTIDIADIAHNEAITGAISVDLGIPGQYFSIEDDYKEELLLGTLINGEWGTRFSEVIRMKLQTVSPISSLEACSRQSPSKKWEPVPDSFLERHRIGIGFEINKTPRIEPRKRVAVYNAAVPKENRPLHSAFNLIRRFAPNRHKERNHFWILSQTGCGKRHLSVAIHEYGYTGIQNEIFLPSLDLTPVAKEIAQPYLHGSSTVGLNVEKGLGLFGPLKNDGCAVLDNMHNWNDSITHILLPILEGQLIPLYGEHNETEKSIKGAKRPPPMVEIDCRFIALLNSDLRQLETLDAQLIGRLQEDFHLIELPSLAERRSDLIVIMAHHADRIIKQLFPQNYERKRLDITGEALCAFYWGNFHTNFRGLVGMLSHIIENVWDEDADKLLIDIDKLPEFQSAVIPESKWNEWIEGLKDNHVVPLFPWWQDDPKDYEIYPSLEDLSKSLYANLIEGHKQGQTGIVSTFFPEAGSKEEAEALWQRLVGLLSVCKAEGYASWGQVCRNSTKPQILTTQMDTTVKQWATKLDLPDDALHEKCKSFFKETGMRE